MEVAQLQVVLQFLVQQDFDLKFVYHVLQDMSWIPLLRISPQTLHQIICIQALINAHQTEATICKEEDGCFG